MEEASREVEVQNRHGLHARPATEFVRVSSAYPCDIIVVLNGLEVNGKSVIEMMTLGAEPGTKLLLKARGPRASELVDALEELMASWKEKEGT